MTSDAFAREKLDHVALLGARLTVLNSAGGRMTDQLTRDMVAAAQKLARQPGAFFVDQLNNPDPIPAYETMAREIWEQCDGRVDGFVQMVGTAGSLRGNTARLRRLNPGIRIVAVEPAESAVLSGGPTGSHQIDGVGAGFVLPLGQDGLADSIDTVTTRDANAMALRLAREEGLFAGASTGGNVIAALRLASELGPGRTVVTVMCDSGLKYLSSAVFRTQERGP